jgi:hypothetical protein
MVHAAVRSGRRGPGGTSAGAGRRRDRGRPRHGGGPVDLITDLPPAAELVGVLAAQAEEALARAGGR